MEWSEYEAKRAAEHAWVTKALSEDPSEREWAFNNPPSSPSDPQRAEKALAQMLKSEYNRNWDVYLDFKRHQQSWHLDEYTGSDEFRRMAAKLQAPWQNGEVIERLLFRRFDRGCSMIEIRELLALVDPERHGKLIAQLFVTTWYSPRADEWRWPEIIDDIRAMWLVRRPSFEREESSPRAHLESTYRSTEEAWKRGKRKHPPEKNGGRFLETWRQLRPMFDWVAKHLEPEDLAVWFSQEFGGSVRQHVAAPYRHLWDVPRAEKAFAADKLILENLFANPPTMPADISTETSKHLSETCGFIRIVELFLALPDKKRPFKLEPLKQLHSVLKEIEGVYEQELKIQAAEREAERVREIAHHELHQSWQERIARRCRGIVQVFNGVFDLDISPDSLLTGEVGGSYASIHSGGGGGPGMHLELRMSIELRQELQVEMGRGTWLELEEGADEAEWAKAYDAENFLVWHELSHLADGPALARMLGSVPEYLALPDDDRRQARELVIDALALSLAEALYVHPDRKRHLVTPVTRQGVMLRALCVQTKRILDWCQKVELDTELECLLERFYAELDAHRTGPEAETIEPVLKALATRLDLGEVRSDRLRAYAAVYAKARRLDVLKLGFHGEVQSLEDESATLGKDDDVASYVGAN